jgi:membrane protease subunit (stomatin/prohibitin family)
MATDKVAGLRERALNGAIDQYTGSAKGPNQEQVFMISQLQALKESDQADAKKAPAKDQKCSLASIRVSL